MCTDLCGCSDTDKDCENKSVDANDDGCNFKDDDNDVYDDENEYEFISVSLRENFLRTQLKTNFCNLLAIRRSFIRGRMFISDSKEKTNQKMLLGMGYWLLRLYTLKRK